MTKQPRSWWKEKRKSLMIVVFTVLVVALIILIVGGYWWKWDWTGFNEHVGPNVQQYQAAKTLWDWLQLLGVLAIPVVVGLGTIWFTTKQAQVSNAENMDTQRETALQAYIDKISELLLYEHLGESPANPQVETIARARTVTVLHILDPVRRGSLIRFLSQAGILVKSTEKAMAGLDLHGADLSRLNLSNTNLSTSDLNGAFLSESDLSGASLILAKLSGAFLFNTKFSGADLTGADIREANLSGADLAGADLRGADLRGADLSNARVDQKQLEEAKSLQGAIMPDGSKHP